MGGLHGIYQVIEIVTQKKKESLIKKFKINTRNLSYTFITVGITFCLVNIAWVFFRANTLSDAIWLLTNIFPLNLQTLFNGNIFEIGLDKADFVLAIIMIISLVIGQIINRKINILESLKKEAWWFRWSIYIILIFTIIILGAYGEYGESQFIYFQF